MRNLWRLAGTDLVGFKRDGASVGTATFRPLCSPLAERIVGEADLIPAGWHAEEGEIQAAETAEEPKAGKLGIVIPVKHFMGLSEDWEKGTFLLILEGTTAEGFPAWEPGQEVRKTSLRGLLDLLNDVAAGGG